MGENREILIKDERNTKGCPDLFCNIFLSSMPKKNKKVQIIGLSECEAKKIHKGLSQLLNEIGGC